MHNAEDMQQTATPNYMHFTSALSMHVCGKLVTCEKTAIM